MRTGWFPWFSTAPLPRAIITRNSPTSTSCACSTEVTPDALADSEPIFKWWRARGNPSPLLMSEEEVRTSTDCFPIEFHDMAERRRVLFGKDVIEDLVIDKVFYRAQIEQELRAKLLRLRQKAAGVLNDNQALLRLMIDSVSNFLVLARHALLVSGIEAGSQKREIAQKLAAIGVDASPFDILLDLREQKRKAADVEPERPFRALSEADRSAGRACRPPGEMRNR